MVVVINQKLPHQRGSFYTGQMDRLFFWLFFEPQLETYIICFDLVFVKGSLSNKLFHLSNAVSAFQEHLLERPSCHHFVHAAQAHALDLAFDAFWRGIA